MKTRTELLNYLIERYGLKSYLEIGVQNRVNFDEIVCDVKFGIDPNADIDFVITSDEYFAKANNLIDLYFIDGDHTAEQAQRDFENSLRCLNDKGFIVLHDCLPTEERFATHDRNTKQWYGTVWQFVMQLHTCDGIRFFTWNADCGCMVIWEDANAKGVPLICGSTWDEYVQFKEVCLNIVNQPAPYLP